MFIFKLSLIVLILSFHFQPFAAESKSACILNNSTSFNHFRDSDIVLGAVVSLYTFPPPRRNLVNKPPVYCYGLVFRYYRHILAIIYAVEEINKNPSLLPNVTLGFDIYDSCADEFKALDSTLKLLTGSQDAIPNYQCGKRGVLAGIIGHMLSSTTKTMAKISGVHFLSQGPMPADIVTHGAMRVSYGAQDPDISDMSIYPSLFRTVPSEQSEYDGYIQLLKYFGWTWVGILTSNDENNLRESKNIYNLFVQNGICVAFYKRILDLSHRSVTSAINDLNYLSVNVVFVFLTSFTFVQIMLTFQKYHILGKVWIMPSTLSVLPHDTFLPTFNGSLAFAIHKGDIPGLKDFIYSANPLTFPDDVFTALVWRDAFQCLPANATKFRNKLGKTWNCTGNETMKIFESFFDVNNFRLTYAVYRATYAMAYAIHDWLLSRNIHQRDLKSFLTSTFHYSKINKYLKNVNFTTPSGENFHFKNREIEGQYDIMNLVLTPNKTPQYIQIGSYFSSAPPGRQLVLNDTFIKWHQIFKEIPQSVCSDSCLPGYRRVPQESQHKCCYDCVQCSEGEISNSTDMENCIKCAKHQWSNERRDKCIPRTIDFLSYEDALGVALSVLAILLSLLTVGILCVFIKHKETPIVKANNRDLSYILLGSLTLSFLCSLLFIGRPYTTICFFRQAAFGIIFGIAVSSVLAKTVTVVVAFNATKPGSKSKKWMKGQVSTYLVCLGSAGEVVICFVWFLCKPPFPDFDTSERSLRMTLQCNEGSSVAFYSLIGYMGFLAVLSFIVAFLARKLPDAFNEAIHITFSMLVFCSVWLSFFPAYLSTKGKNMVAVEIFAMLASSGGLLCCIFLPKCYIILIRPELNSKECLIGKKTLYVQ